MKLWKKILLGIAALVALLLVIALFLPSKWKVERSVSIASKPERILPLIADLHQWKDWAAWNSQLDPTMQTTYSGSAQGAGATMSWKGEKMGIGTLTITEADPVKGVRYDMKMEEQQTPAHGQFNFSADGEGTKVTWVDEGDMGMFLPGRYFVSMLEKQLGEHFEIGLKNLKKLAETPAAPKPNP